MFALSALALITVVSITSVDHVTSYTYLVVSPRNIRPDAVMDIRAHFARPVNNEKFTAKIIRINRDGLLPSEEVLVERTVNVPNGAKQIKALLTVPPKITWGSYRLNVSATGSIKFDNSSSLYGRPNGHLIFIQSDKKKYKPGETVNYRVFIVAPNLDLRAPVFKVEIFDPKDNKIDELTNQRGYYGMEGSLELSSITPLGRWKIVVTIDVYDETETQFFDVEEYVLPKFEVTVVLPPFGQVSDPSLIGSVTAKYTFGKPVKGNVIITASRRYGTGFFRIAGIRREMPIDGTASFSIPTQLLKRLSDRLQHETILVHANVTETITGITLENQAEIRFYDDSYTVEFYPNLPDNFKKGFNPYKVWIKIAQQDGRPPQSATEKLKVTVTFFTEVKVIPPLNAISVLNYKLLSPFKGGDVIALEAMNYSVSKDGIVKFDLKIPDEASTASIKAEYKGASATKDLRRFRTLGGDLMKAELLEGNTRKLEIGMAATFRVTVTDRAVSTVFYAILSRGQIVECGDVNIVRSTQYGNVQVIVTRSMAPSARFVAYYVKSNGEILADGFNFVVQEIFENKVGITFDQSSPQEPKTNVSLRVTADTGSVVNVLAVDKSVALLASGNDIDRQRVKDKMSEFGDSPWFPRAGWGDFIFPWPLRADDPSDVFSTAQLITLTDGDLFSFDLWRLERQNFKVQPRSGVRMAMESSSAFAGDGGGAPPPAGQIRKDFPETWIWKSATAVNGVAVFPELTPDTITTFVANAFALNEKTGLGVAAAPANMTVFLPFFVNLQLPYSAVRGEVVVIQANIFNYLNVDYNVKVVLKNLAGEFVGIYPGQYGKEQEISGDIEKCVTVKVNEVRPVFFAIKPTKIGSIEIRIRATIPLPANRFDEVVRQLPVKAEGLEKEKNTQTLIVLETAGTKHETIPINYPLQLVPDSARLQVTVFGDLLGISLTNLESLIRIPSGCGEQNMVKFAPSVFAANYMNSTFRLENNTELLERITRALKIGYQRQLLYQRHDGSFSAFGDADDEGSLWLTAFVGKSFAQASKIGLIYIDPNVLDKAVRFIAQNQGRDGFMINVGTVIHKALQGSSASSRNALSSYILIALHEIKKAEILEKLETIRTLDETILSLADALELNYLSMNTDYERAIGAYALKLVKKARVSSLLLSSLEGSTNAVKQGNLIQYWKHTSKAISIEITSYALLTYAAPPEDLAKGTSILLWLVRQRNPYGGFISTQDTVVALQALTAFAALIYTKNVNMEIDVCTVTNNVEGIKEKRLLNSENHDVLQFIDFPDGHVDSVSISAKGTGTALISVGQFFNVESDTSSAYTLNVTIFDETPNRYTMTVCASYTKPNELTSNMAIIDVGVVSGFEAVKDDVQMGLFMKRIERSDGGLIIYFDEIPRFGVCVDVPVQRLTPVANTRPAVILVYTYYNPIDERMMVQYLPTLLKDRPLCDTCPGCCLSEVCTTNTSG